MSFGVLPPEGEQGRKIKFRQTLQRLRYKKDGLVKKSDPPEADK